MDLWAVHVKNTTRSSYLPWKSYSDNPISSRNLRKMVSFHVGEKMLEIRVSKVSVPVYQSFVVRSMGKKNPQNSNSSSSSGNGDHSIPEGDGLKGNNPSSEGNKSSDTGPQKSHHKTLDWREFRAALYIEEQYMLSKQDDGTTLDSRRLGPKWAHPLSSPETGCVLVATEKLDGVGAFERSVVLLLRSGTSQPQEGPFGVVINRPLHKKIKHMKPTNLDLATTFADCSLYFGGPLEASMFLLRAGGKSGLGFEEVVPGLCFGARNSLDEAAVLVKKGFLKPHDFMFFVGYAGWQLDQLREEIESGYWHVAASSANLIFGGLPHAGSSSSLSSSEGLWEEILQQMGGRYSELSRKPKQDM